MNQVKEPKFLLRFSIQTSMIKFQNNISRKLIMK
jgi:hypothetical protein